MIELYINNSTCRITGLSLEQHRDVRNLLCYNSDPKVIYFSGKYLPPKRYLIDNKGNFPTGLLHYVENYLVRNKEVVIKDQRITPIKTNGMFKLKLDQL